MTKEQEIMSFLHERVFDPILRSESGLKAGVSKTIERMSNRDAAGMIDYYWWLVGKGSELSDSFAAAMKREGFTRFEDIQDEFRARFG